MRCFIYNIYVDLESLKQSKSDGGIGMGGGEENEKERRESPTPFIKSLLDASVPPRAKSDYWLSVLSREERGYQKYDSGGDHYYVGCLGQTCVWLSE